MARNAVLVPISQGSEVTIVTIATEDVPFRYFTRVSTLSMGTSPITACYDAFQRWIPASAKSQRRREFVAEEKKSEIRWRAADYIARRPSHFGGLWRAA